MAWYSHQRGPQNSCGCYYIVPSTGEVKSLPQVQLKAHGTVLSTTTRTLLTQTFINPSAEQPIQQAVYSFPLFDGVSVVGFNCRIGSRTIRGTVKEKEQARKIYEHAVSQGQTAGLLEQLTEASDVFSTRIGNIPPKTEVVVELTYLGELKHDAEVDGIRYTIPTTIAPRYGTPPVKPTFRGLAGAATAQESGGIEIIVDVLMEDSCKIKGIQSPSHPIAMTLGRLSPGEDDCSQEMSLCRASATLSLGTTALDKDFILLILAENIITPRAFMEVHPSIPNQRALMLSLVPKFNLPKAQNPEIVFVVDRSGSMEDKVGTLITALQVFLKSLPIGTKFNLCSFGSTYSFLWKRSRSYDRDSLQQALDQVSKFRADLGGTEMLQPIQAVIENRFKDLPLEVMLLTDGEIWDQDRLFSYLKEEIKTAKKPFRCFSLGIGSSVSHALIEGIARAGNGFSQAVGENEKLDGKVVRMLKGALTPHTDNYSLEVVYAPSVETDDEEYDLVDRVADCLNISAASSVTETPPPTYTERPTISLFDPAADVDMKTEHAETEDTERFRHLPDIPTPKVLQAPWKIPPLYPFARSVVYLLLSPDAHQRTPKSVILRGKSEHGPLELSIPVTILDRPSETIHQLAAKKAIQDFEEGGRGWLHEAKVEGNTLVSEKYEGRWDEIIRREAVRLSTTFQVAGKWSSFVAVEENNETPGEETPVGTTQVPAAAPTSPPNPQVARSAVSQSRGGFTLGGIPVGLSGGGGPGAAEKKRSLASAPKTSLFGAKLFGSASSGPADTAKSITGFGGQSGNEKFLISPGSRGVQLQQAVTRGAPPRDSNAVPWHSATAAAAQMQQQQQSQMMPQPAPMPARPAPPGSSGIRSRGQAPVPPPPEADEDGSESANKFVAGEPLTDQELYDQNPDSRLQESLFPAGQTPGLNSFWSKRKKSSAPSIGGLFGRAKSGKLEHPSSTSFSSAAADSGIYPCAKPGPAAELPAAAASYSAPGYSSAPYSARSSSPPAPALPLHRLIALQTFDGSWDALEPVCAIAGVREQDVRALGELPAGLAAQAKAVLATMLAVVYLEAKMGGERETWELVVEKALGWLEVVISGTEVDFEGVWKAKIKGLLDG